MLDFAGGRRTVQRRSGCLLDAQASERKGVSVSKADNQARRRIPTRGAASSKSQAENLTQVRLTYVWDWWKFHAKQRTDMFNYFLIVTGILANAYVSLLKDQGGQPALAIGLGILGALASAGFWLLDVRNRRQLERATLILRRIESDQLGDQDGPLGLADIGGSPIYKHKFVFRTIEGIVGLGWLLIILWSILVR